MDSELEQRFEKLQTFIIEHIASKQDLLDLKQELPTKVDFQNLQSSVDTIARLQQDNANEIKVLGAQITRLEQWVINAAPKLGVEYKP